MDEVRLHNLLTFYLPFVILISCIYDIFNENHRALVYVISYLTAYLAIRLEIHHYAHRWSSYRDQKFVKALVISELLVVGLLLPTVFTFSTKRNINRGLMIFFVISVFIYIVVSRTINRVLERRLLGILLGLSLVILVITQSVLEPAVFALLSLWMYLILKHELVLYASNISNRKTKTETTSWGDDL